MRVPDARDVLAALLYHVATEHGGRLVLDTRDMASKKLTGGMQFQPGARLVIVAAELPSSDALPS